MTFPHPIFFIYDQKTTEKITENIEAILDDVHKLQQILGERQASRTVNREH